LKQTILKISRNPAPFRLIGESPNNYNYFLAPPNLVRLSAFPALVTVLVVCLEPVTLLVCDFAIVLNVNY